MRNLFLCCKFLHCPGTIRFRSMSALCLNIRLSILRCQEGLRTELRKLFAAKTIEEARVIRDEIIADYSPVAEKAMSILDNGFEDAMTVMVSKKEGCSLSSNSLCFSTKAATSSSGIG